MSTIPTGTLATNCLLDIWLPIFAKESAAAVRLHGMWLHHKAGAERDALLEGYWALCKAARATAEHIRLRGGILFVWDGSAALNGGAA